MGFFSKKKKMTVDDMAMQTMAVAVDTVEQFKGIDTSEDIHSRAVSLGYFYGFMKMNLNKVAGEKTASIILSKAIAELENTSKDIPQPEIFFHKVNIMTKNASSNLEYAMKNMKDEFFKAMGIFYLNDLSNTIDISKTGFAKENMRMLYRISSDLICFRNIQSPPKRSGPGHGRERAKHSPTPGKFPRFFFVKKSENSKFLLTYHENRGMMCEKQTCSLLCVNLPTLSRRDEYESRTQGIYRQARSLQSSHYYF